MPDQTLSGEPARFAGGLHEVAAGTYAWLQPDGGLGESNAGLVVGDGGSLLIDTLWDERLTEGMLAAMGPHVAGAPIATVLNTHSDGDHWWGNSRVPATASIVASEACVEAMKHDIKPRELALMSGALGLAARLPFARGLAPGAASFAPFAFGDIRLRYPDRTFERETTLDVGGREVVVRQVGPAHSPADCIAFVPDVGVAFAADILFVGIAPMMWVGPVENWLSALDYLLGLDASVYVPGHGPVTDRAGVIAMRDYWLALHDHARAAHAAGVSVIDATRSFMRELTGWLEPERAVVSIDAVYRALDGRAPVGARGPERVRLMRSVVGLRGAE